MLPQAKEKSSLLWRLNEIGHILLAHAGFQEGARACPDVFGIAEGCAQAEKSLARADRQLTTALAEAGAKR